MNFLQKQNLIRAMIRGEDWAAVMQMWYDYVNLIQITDQEDMLPEEFVLEQE